MKNLISISIFCFWFHNCFSQAGEWVWVKGDSIPDQPGNYGIQGVPSPTNNPPALYEACEWTDLNGNFWLFGGSEHLNFGANYGDLWKYNPLTNEWTWMKGSGSSNDMGHYGIQGIPSTINNPPSRGLGILSWTDNLGNLWMYGGDRFADNYNDLWKYNISTNVWTWMKGSNVVNQLAVYGLQGIPAITNDPGSRKESGASWADDTGNLWFFGGGNNSSSFNDVWKYNISTNQWTWMKGSQLSNQQGVYGTLGIEDTLNTPGTRWTYNRWKDNSGRFWLFGGMDFNNGIGYRFNDIWSYNPMTNNWAWMAGDSVSSSPGIFGNACDTMSFVVPCSRFENRASWTDQFGFLWFFGGYNFSTLNDLWKYCITNNQWTRMDGDSVLNPAGSWGTMGVYSPNNKINGRCGSMGWTANNNLLYLFGGANSNGHWNDLWIYAIDTACGVCPTTTEVQENNPPKTDQLQIFPNPANTSLTISFLSLSKQNIGLRIYDALGRQVYNAEEEVVTKNFEKEIHVEKWRIGIYFLQLKIKEGIKNKKISVQH